MNKSVLRVFLLIGCVLLLAYSLFVEKHQINSYMDKTARESGGANYVESLESGVLLRTKAGQQKGKDGVVYNAKTLIPEAAQIDDCPT